MTCRRPVALSLALLAVAFAVLLHGGAGEPAPPLPRDLLIEADGAEPEIALILRKLAVPADELVLNDGTRIDVDPVHDYLQPGQEGTRTLRRAEAAAEVVKVAEADIAKTRYYEQAVLDAAGTLRKTANLRAGAWVAEKTLRAALRFSRSRRQAPATADPWKPLQDRLADELVDVRRQLLLRMSEGDDRGEALRWADVWLPLVAPESPLSDDVRKLWIDHAGRLIKAGDAGGARKWLDRVNGTFWHSPQAGPLRKELRSRAEAMLRTSADLPDAKAVALLQEAQALWPRLPGLGDALAKRRRDYQVLYVAVRDLPEFMSPELAWTDAERQTVELVFESLVGARHDAAMGPRYRAVLADRLPTGTGVRRAVRLRRDVYWGDGERFTATDVRHTLQLEAHARQGSAARWRDLLEPPMLAGNPFRLELVYREGLLDPSAPLLFKVLPQSVRGKPLMQANDPDFARQPVGTGPYQFGGKEAADGRTYLILRANPRYVRAESPAPGSMREIRFFAWKADAPQDAPPPDLVLDVLPAQAAALMKQGKAALHNLPVPRVWYLGLNHRRPAFARLPTRLALAQAVDRQGLLDRHFRTSLPEKSVLTVNGLFPRDSWANSPASLVPEELYRPEEARSSARRAGKELGKAEWTLKYPAGDSRLDAAFKDLAEHVPKVLAGGGMQVVIHLVPLPPRAMQAAVRARDFDLIYLPIDLPADPAAVKALFDARAEAVEPGGSNILGYAHDPRLHELLRAAMHHRYFPDVQRSMQGVHQQFFLQMPLVPLWQLPYSVAVGPRLRTPELDPLAIFGNVLDWKLSPP